MRTYDTLYLQENRYNESKESFKFINTFFCKQKNVAEGDAIHWLLLTVATPEVGFSEAAEHEQAECVEAIAAAYPFTSVHQLGFPATRLDTIPLSDLITRIASIVKQLCPHTVYLSFYNDPHSDHRCAFEATYSCTKYFRFPSIKHILMMETPSEADFTPLSGGGGSSPPIFLWTQERH